MHKNQRGSVATVLVAISVLGLAISVVGYNVWNNQNNKPASSTKSSNSTANASSGKDNAAAVPPSVINFDPASSIASYSVPAGWKYIECKTNVMMLVPEGEATPDCRPDQPNTPMTVSVRDNYNKVDYTNCDDVKAKDPALQPPGFISLSCQNVTIGGKVGARTVLSMTKPNFYDADYTDTTYQFPTKDDGVLTVNYTKLAGTKDFTSGFDQFAKSLVFKN